MKIIPFIHLNRAKGTFDFMNKVHKRVFLQVDLFQKLATSVEHVVYQNCSECQNKTKTTICVHNMFCRYSELTIFMNNEQSVDILWAS